MYRVTTSWWPTVEQLTSASSALWSGCWSNCWGGMICLSPPCTESPSPATTRCTSSGTCSWVGPSTCGHACFSQMQGWTYKPAVWFFVCVFAAWRRFHLLLPHHFPGGSFSSDQHFHHLPAGADWHAPSWRDRFAIMVFGRFTPSTDNNDNR